MTFIRLFRKLSLVLILALAGTPLFAGVFVSVNFAPPPIPVYEQPYCPGDGYLWTPGYWGYGEFGYYWVPGVWIQPPSIGVLWTPGYWGWGGGSYFFHSGYWGPHVGFYGGIDYGFGYGGEGYRGGRWDGNRFAYNTVVNRVNVNIHNTYVDRNGINNNNSRRVSYNGGNGGIQARPTGEQQSFAREQHIQPTASQQTHMRTASLDRRQYASANGGRPGTLAETRPGNSQRAKESSTAAAVRDNMAEKRSASPTGNAGELPQHREKTENVEHQGASTYHPQKRPAARGLGQPSGLSSFGRRAQ